MNNRIKTYFQINVMNEFHSIIWLCQSGLWEHELHWDIVLISPPGAPKGDPIAKSGGATISINPTDSFFVLSKSMIKIADFKRKLRYFYSKRSKMWSFANNRISEVIKLLSLKVPISFIIMFIVQKLKGV